MQTRTRSLTFPEFVELCKDADEFVRELLREPSKLQGKQRKTLKAAAVWYLARKRGLHVTANNLYQIYGVYRPKLTEIHKLIEKEK